MLAAIDCEARLFQALADDLCIVEVIGDVLTDFLLAFLGINRLCAALDDIRNAVHLGGLAAVPELIEGYSVVFELLRDHAERAACAGKARRLGKTAEFDCALLGPFDLKNAVGHVRIGDKCFICRVIEKDGLILQRIIHPFFQSFLCNTHSGGIVWETQIDHVHRLLRDLRQEAVFLLAGHVHNLAPTLALYVVARTSGHDVGVHIDRVDWVAHRDDIVHAKDVADAAGVALRAVADKNLIRRNINPAGLKIIFCDCLTEERITRFGAIAAERLRFAHLLRSGTHRLDDCLWQRAGHVADPQADDLLLRVLLHKGVHLIVDVHKQIAGRKLDKILIDFQQIENLLKFVLAHRMTNKILYQISTVPSKTKAAGPSI